MADKETFEEIVKMEAKRKYRSHLWQTIFISGATLKVSLSREILSHILQDFSIEDPTGNSYEQRIIMDNDFTKLIESIVASFDHYIYNKREWISLETELPPICTSILINGRNGINIHYYSNGYSTLEDFKNSGATHWMKLPPSPNDK